MLISYNYCRVCDLSILGMCTAGGCNCKMNYISGREVVNIAGNVLGSNIPRARIVNVAGHIIGGGVPKG